MQLRDVVVGVWYKNVRENNQRSTGGMKHIREDKTSRDTIYMQNKTRAKELVGGDSKKKVASTSLVFTFVKHDVTSWNLEYFNTHLHIHCPFT